MRLKCILCNKKMAEYKSVFCESCGKKDFKARFSSLSKHVKESYRRSSKKNGK